MTARLDTLWYTRCSVPTAVGLAAQLRWLEQELGHDGIAVRSIRDSEDRTVRDSHFDHNQKYSIRQGGSVPAIWARAEGRDTRVVGLLWAEESQQILTHPTTGIRTVKDLASRRLGVPRFRSDRFPRLDVRAATALRGYASALATEGLSLEDVQLVSLENDDPFPEKRSDALRSGGYNEEVFALVRGRVDAIFVKGARGREVEADVGAREVIDLGKHPDPEVRINNGLPRPLTIDGDLARDYPEVVEQVLATVVRAGEWAKDHPAETVAHVARETRSSEDFVARAYPALHLHLVTALPDAWIDALQKYTTFLADHSFLKSDFDVRSWIDRAPLEALQRRGAIRLSA